MSKYRDHRDQHRHRHHDEDGRFSELTAEPSYFLRLPAAGSDHAGAEVVWFNASKGFGFVKLEDGTEVYLHARALESAGSREVSEGTHLKVRLVETPRGRQVAQVLEIDDTIPRTSLQGSRTRAASARNVPELKGEGTVKWYNAEKGFGFITPSSGDKDIFVHVTALTRSGLAGLTEGQRVFVECGQGRKGLEVQNIRLA